MRGRSGDVVFLVVDGGVESLEDDQLSFDDSGADVHARSIAGFLFHFRNAQVEQLINGSGSSRSRFLRKWENEGSMKTNADRFMNFVTILNI